MRAGPLAANARPARGEKNGPPQQARQKVGHTTSI